MSKVIITYKDGTKDEVDCKTNSNEVIGFFDSPIVSTVRFNNLVVRLDEVRSVKMVDE